MIRKRTIIKKARVEIDENNTTMTTLATTEEIETIWTLFGITVCRESTKTTYDSPSAKDLLELYYKKGTYIYSSKGLPGQNGKKK